MKRLILGIMTVIMLVLTGCGDDTTVVVPVTSPPSITALSPLTKVTVNQNHLVFGSVNFHAPQVDLDFMTVSVVDSTGFEVYRTNVDLIIFRGVEFGTIPFVIDYDTFLQDRYTVTVFLTDLAGAFSNAVSDRFDVP